MKCRTVISLLALCLTAAAAAAQQLEPGRVIGATTGNAGAVFAFRAQSAGVLTVIVRATDRSDLAVFVADEDGQSLPEGQADQDLRGNAGAEQVAVTIPRAGAYTVRVASLGEGAAAFRIAASWVAFPELETPADPDGAPSRATPLAAKQQSLQDSLSGSVGDDWDWFVVTAERAGTLTVVTRAEEGDLVLESYRPGEYGSPAERSDQDLQEAGGNEALTLSVTAGQKLFFKVSAIGDGGPVKYRLQISFIPD